jgi:type I restriction enzyme S subunit
MPFPLAPIGEQGRIAERLDALLAQVDACRKRLDRLPAILQRFRQAVCDAAATGALTEDWREEQSMSPSEWADTTVGEVADTVFDGPFGSHLKSLDYADAGIRVVRLENIAPLSFIEDKRTYISEEKFAALTRHTLLAGDVLFSSFVDQEVRVCLLPEALSGIAINKADCFCIRANRDKCDPRFLAIKLATRSTFTGLDDLIHGATRPRINLGQLRAIRLQLPTLDEQAEIVRRVESLFALAAAIDACYAAAREKVERLTPALLAKAFRGELVPQYPNDEPASVLLARVRGQAEHDVAPARKLVRRKATKETVA